MPAHERSTQTESALAPYLRAARIHRRLIAAIAIVAVVAGVAYAQVRGQQYEATARILVTPLSDAGAYTGLPVLTTSVEPTRTMQTAASMLESSQVAIATAREVPGWGADQIAAAVTVEPQGESSVITVTANADSAAAAGRIAQTYAEQALSARGDVLASKAASDLAAIRAQQRSLAPGDTSTATMLAGESAALQRVANGQDPNFSLMPSGVTAAPVGTPTPLLVALALFAGLAVGLGAALALEYVNRRVRDEDELLSLYPLPVLTRVPLLPRSAYDAAAGGPLPPRVLEAFTTLQVQLDHGGEHGRVVMITSPSMGDGKTTAAVNLARSLGAAGFRVILLDLDLRKPDLADQLGTYSDVMDVLRSDVTLDDVLATVQGQPSLRLLGARPSSDVAPLLRALSRRIPELLGEARTLADYVIIDTAPLGEVSDALRVAGATDDLVLVVRPGHTDRVALERARELLEQLGHTPTGLLVMGDEAASRSAYGYGYGGERRQTVGRTRSRRYTQPERPPSRQGKAAAAAKRGSPVPRAGEAKLGDLSVPAPPVTRAGSSRQSSP